MNVLRTITGKVGLVLLVVAVAVGCTDSFLSVDDNPNQPNRERALANPSDVESLIGDSFFQYWSGWHLWNPSIGLTNAANEFRGGFPFPVKRILGRVPRTEWKNSPSFDGSGHTAGPWGSMYGAISAANDGLKAIESAREDEDTQFLDQIDDKRAEAFAKFVQGISHASVAAMFDRGYVVTEDTTFQKEAPALVGYPKVMSRAMDMFDASIQIAQNNSFQLPSTWISGNPMTSDEFARFVRAVKARKMTQVARTPDERAHDGSENYMTNETPGLINWNEVIRLTKPENGIQESVVVQLDGLGGNLWGMFNVWIMGQSDSWGRISYYTLGPAGNKSASDEGMSFSEWLSTETTRSSERSQFTIHTQDRRIVGAPPDSVAGTPEQWEVPGTDYMNLGYGFSSDYAHVRLTNGAGQPDILTNDDVGPNTGSNMVGPLNWVLKAEVDLMRAEGLLRTGGSRAKVQNLINNTREERGELPPATSSNPIGSWEDPIKNGYPSNGYTDVSLWSMLKYEKTIEQYATATGLSYFDKRGWEDLVAGTPLQFPLPGGELVTLQLDQYTFGGTPEDPYSADPGWNPADYK